MTTVIPEQLNAPGLRFVKLLPKSKKPFEKNWPKKPYTIEEIKPWVAKGNNYGILGGHGDIVPIDADSAELAEYLLQVLPRTFTVKTPKKGMHFYVFCPQH